MMVVQLYTNNVMAVGTYVSTSMTREINLLDEYRSYSGNVWQRESLANLANCPWCVKLKSVLAYRWYPYDRNPFFFRQILLASSAIRQKLTLPNIPAIPYAMARQKTLSECNTGAITNIDT